MPPDQFSFDGFEERFYSGIIVAIALATHRSLEAMLAQDFLIIVGTILAAPVGMVDAALWRRTERDSHFKCSDRQIPLHPVADRPANDTAGMQAKITARYNHPSRVQT